MRRDRPRQTAEIIAPIVSIPITATEIKAVPRRRKSANTARMPISKNTTALPMGPNFAT